MDGTEPSESESKIRMKSPDISRGDHTSTHPHHTSMVRLLHNNAVFLLLILPLALRRRLPAPPAATRKVTSMRLTRAVWVSTRALRLLLLLPFSVALFVLDASRFVLFTL